MTYVDETTPNHFKPTKNTVSSLGDQLIEPLAPTCDDLFYL